MLKLLKFLINFILILNSKPQIGEKEKIILMMVEQKLQKQKIYFIFLLFS